MITHKAFPVLEQETILGTSKAIHSYAKLLGAIRAQMTPQQKEYWHISLRAGTQGFRTTPIPYGDGSTFEMSLNLLTHTLHIITSTGHTRNVALTGQSIENFSSEVLSILHTMNIDAEVDPEKFSDSSQMEYNQAIASDIFKSYAVVDTIFKTFKGSVLFESSPVQLWPHHMDIAFTCYPGGENEKIDQIGFGYLTGDEAVSEPYFYITAYPELEDVSDITLEQDAYWNPEGWQGVVLKYKDLINTDNPAETLITHLDRTYDQILKTTK